MVFDHNRILDIVVLCGCAVPIFAGRLGKLLGCKLHWCLCPGLGSWYHFHGMKSLNRKYASIVYLLILQIDS